MFGYTIKTEKQYQAQVLTRSQGWLADQLILRRAAAINAMRRRMAVKRTASTEIPASERGAY